jgi:succinate dehydrogenase / fumarate reductase cytochrome b subunit
MVSLFRFLQSSILSKVVMAGTGIVLVLFLCGHMAGNLQMYLGQDRMNHYAETLQGLGAALWVIRGTLIVLALLHIVTSIWLKLLDMRARPVAYVVKKWVRANLPSRTMLWTGSLVACFLLYHLLHLTVGSTNPAQYHVTDAMGRHDVYSMVILGFSNPFIAGLYIAGMLLLGFHLYHAIGSAFQTLGINHEKYNGFIQGLSITVALVIGLGFAAIPAGVQLGIITLPAGGM